MSSDSEFLTILFKVDEFFMKKSYPEKYLEHFSSRK